METDAGVAAKVTLVAPTGTTTETGTVRLALLLERETAYPPVGEALAKVTVQVEVAGDATGEGLQPSPLRRDGKVTRILPPVPAGCTVMRFPCGSEIVMFEIEMGIEALCVLAET